MSFEQTIPRASVIMPTLNNMDTLPAALASIQNQSLKQIEIIIVNDGSNDGSEIWLREQAQIDRRIRLIETQRLGPPGARNEAISIASAPIVAFLDADDVWLPGKLRFQIEYMERQPDIGLTFMDYRHVGPTGDDRGTCFEYWVSSFRTQPPAHFFQVPEPEALLLKCNLIGTSTVAVRTDVLRNANGFATELCSAEDWDLWLRLAAATRFAATSMIAMDYLMRPDSESSRRVDRIRAIEQIASRYKDRSERSIRSALRSVRARLERAKAEILRSEAFYSASALAEIRSLIAAPDRRAFRAAGGDTLKAVRRLRNQQHDNVVR